jgi:OOP family OmpA-OmpF porin
LSDPGRAAPPTAGGRKEALEGAMGPIVERSLQASIKKDPQVYIDMLAPVLLPGVRIAISQAIRTMVQSLNTVLEQTMSLRALGWRVESWRSGRPIGEIALLRSLVFRVEVVQLVHRESGLLLTQATAPGVQLANPEVVAAVSTAMQDFVRESFTPGDRVSGQLRSMQVGEHTVWIDAGQRASLIGIIRGHPPESLHNQFHDTLHTIERQMSAQLRDFSGDTRPFASVDLTPCFAEQRRQRRGPWRAYSLLAIVGGLLLAWGIAAAIMTARLGRYLDILQHTPGIVVTASARHKNHLVVRGLRDAYARDPGSLVAQTKLDPRRVELHMAPFISLDPAVLSGRLRTVLEPPPGVTLRPEGDQVVVSGHAPRAWIEAEHAKRKAEAGMLPWQERDLVEDEALEMSELSHEIAGSSLRFRTNSSRIDPDQRAAIEAVATDAHRLDQLSEATGRRAVVVVTGHADRPGPAAFNRALSRARAGAVRDELVARGVNQHDVVTLGVDTAGAERSVSFEVKM